MVPIHGTHELQPLVANNAEYNYGPTGQDRRRVLNFNYTANFRNPASSCMLRCSELSRTIGSSRGITTMSTGSPFTPGLSTNPTVDITGSSSLGARIQVIGQGQASGPGANHIANNVGQPTYFNTAAFGEPAVGTIGNAGVNILRNPGFMNFDASIARRIPVGHNEKRVFVLRFQKATTSSITRSSAVRVPGRLQRVQCADHQYLRHGDFYASRAYLFGRASLRVLM